MALNPTQGLLSRPPKSDLMVRPLPRTVLPFLLSLLFPVVSSASHVSGVDIGYECLGNNQYMITLNIFRDCDGITMSNTEDVEITSSCGQSLTVTLQQAPGTGDEISQLCPSDLSNSTCSGGGLPGMEYYTYQGIVTLNPPCNSWTVGWGTCCRNVSANVPTSSLDDIWAEAVLNTATAPCNNSPIFTAQPIPYVCAGFPVSYNYGVFDPDGDSLVFSFVPGQMFNNSFLTYGAGFSGANPVPGITLDPNTGEVTFNVAVTGNYIVVVEVEQYDSNGNLVGTVMRDMQFTVIACTNIPTTAPAAYTNFNGSALSTGPTSLEMCLGDQFCMDLTFTDADAGDSLTLTSNITLALPGATFTQTGVNPATATVCWTAIAGTSPVTTFSVVAEDDACPVTSLVQQTITVLFLPRTLTVDDSLLCEPAPVTLTTVGGTVFTWSVLSGDPIVLGQNFSCNPCADPIATPANTTTYEVVSDLQSTCVNRDTVTIYVIPPFGFSAVTPYQTTCNGDSDGYVEVEPWGTAGPAWSWDVIDANNATVLSTTTNGATTLSGLTEGTYTLVLGEPIGCTHDTTFYIAQPDVVIASVSDTTICLSTSAVISASAVGGNGGYTYSWNQGLVGDGPHTVTPSTTTVYQAIATDMLGCTSAPVQTTVTVLPALTVVASGPDSICIGADAVLSALAGGGNGGPYAMVWTEIGGGVVGAGASIFVVPTAFGTDYVVTLNDNCNTPIVRDTVHVQWYRAPEPNFTADKREDCFPAEITFTNTTDPDDVGTDCLWNFGDGNTATGCATAFNSYANVGCYDVTLTVYSPEGCMGDTTFPQFICARPYPIADFRWTPEVANILDPQVAFFNQSQFDVSWAWSFGADCDPDSAFFPDPVVLFPETEEATYPVWLHVTNEFGCPDSIMKLVFIEGVFSVYVPNAFTPDGDGVNDHFGPLGQGISDKEFEFTVFDRWGQPVFATNDPGQWWDGKVSGAEQVQGVYAWRLDLVDKYESIDRQYFGHVTLVR